MHNTCRSSPCATSERTTTTEQRPPRHRLADAANGLPTVAGPLSDRALLSFRVACATACSANGGLSERASASVPVPGTQAITAPPPDHALDRTVSPPPAGSAVRAVVSAVTSTGASSTATSRVRWVEVTLQQHAAQLELHIQVVARELPVEELDGHLRIRRWRRSQHGRVLGQQYWMSVMLEVGGFTR
jgi:hypothetical protein